MPSSSLSSAVCLQRHVAVGVQLEPFVQFPLDVVFVIAIAARVTSKRRRRSPSALESLIVPSPGVQVEVVFRRSTALPAWLFRSLSSAATVHRIVQVEAIEAAVVGVELLTCVLVASRRTAVFVPVRLSR
jgi:hypothetical protein